MKHLAGYVLPQQDQQQQFVEAPVFTISNYRNQDFHPFHPNLQHKQQTGGFLLTNRLFQHHNHHFQPFEQQEGDPVRQASPCHLNFNLGLTENRSSKEAFEEEEGPFLHGSQIPHSWPLTNNDKNGCIEHEEHAREGNNKYDNHKLLQHFDQGSSKNLDNRLFNELEAIYGLSNMGEANQTASGSALTWENSTTNAKLSLLFGHVNGQNVAARGTANAAIGVDHESETSLGEEAALRKSQKRKRKWKVKENLGYITWCLENFVKQVIDHQEKLHCMFLGVIEKMEKERAEREEAWRRQEVALHNREAMARAHEQILASNRDAVIVSCIEKITGQSIDLPKRKIAKTRDFEATPQPIDTHENRRK
ncbi:trihelix transcription factor GTL2-like isoform X2 [Tripterygium wilfordii]|uniref:trihelix transcription factor GTL2-like isoform X2 n=1 Tax=Tripterygium wilfordii TaxID=458696 RepID=UPI0018F85429|nr:trihelix transcription factor GTL2-like isoform X2 [Tripterygium wilfordii]